MNLNVDPKIEYEMNDVELYEQEQIVLNGELTVRGQNLYESMTEMVYDEVDGKWIEIPI